MSGSLRLIKNQIKAVGGIKKMTRAMEMVSANKMKKAVGRSVATAEYASLALELMMNMSRLDHLEHPLLDRGRGDKILVVLITANRGLCGGYNIGVAKKLKAFLAEHENRQLAFVTVGRYGERLATRARADILASFVDLPESVRPDNTTPISQLVINEFTKGDYEKVVIIYTSFVSPLVYRPMARILLPVEPENIKQIIEELGEYDKAPKFVETDMSRYLFEPNTDELLDEVLPDLVSIAVYQAIVESFASEHSARMTAMKTATDNATSLVDSLTLSYNRARQESITREIIEVSAGAQSLTVNN